MTYDFSKVVKIGKKILLSKGGLVVPLVKGDTPVPPEPTKIIKIDSISKSKYDNYYNDTNFGYYELHFSHQLKTEDLSKYWCKLIIDNELANESSLDDEDTFDYPNENTMLISLGFVYKEDKPYYGMISENNAVLLPHEYKLELYNYDSKTEKILDLIETDSIEYTIPDPFNNAILEISNLTKNSTDNSISFKLKFVHPEYGKFVPEYNLYINSNLIGHGLDGTSDGYIDFDENNFYEIIGVTVPDDIDMSKQLIITVKMCSKAIQIEDGEEYPWMSTGNEITVTATV